VSSGGIGSGSKSSSSSRSGGGGGGGGGDVVGVMKVRFEGGKERMRVGRRGRRRRVADEEDWVQ